MILGIFSDTHGDAERARRGLALLGDRGAEAFVHCGDVGGEDVLAEMTGRELWFVWGNCDYPDAALERYVRTLGLTPPDAIPLRLELAGKSMAVFHGHEREWERFDRDEVDYVFHGHTHLRRDERVGRTRIINPGALHRAKQYTVATLDLSSDTLEFHVVA